NMTFESLLGEDYQMVEELAKYAGQVRFESENVKRRVCINRAIALRDSGVKDGIEEVLSMYDWSAAALVFKVATAAVREHQDDLYDLLPRAVAGGELTRQDLEDWPLFRPFRGTERFDAMIAKLFTEKTN